MSSLPFVQPEPWMAEAECAGADADLWFPERGATKNHTAQAKAVCRRCTVRAECLHYATVNNEHHGIWGGLSERERRLGRSQTLASPTTAEKIMEIVAARGPSDPAQVARALGMSLNTAQVLLRELTIAGRMVRSRPDGAPRPYVYEVAP